MFAFVFSFHVLVSLPNSDSLLAISIFSDVQGNDVATALVDDVNVAVAAAEVTPSLGFRNFSLGDGRT